MSTQGDVTKRPLPAGWRWVRLGDMCDIRMGETLIEKDLTGDGIPVFSANTSEKPWGFTSCSRLKFDQTSIVIGARGSIGLPKWPNIPEWTATQTTIVLTVQNTQLLKPEWLFRALQHVDFRELTAQQAIPMITVRDVENIEILLPPLAEQQRIAAILREQMAAVERARRAAEEQLEATRALPAAFLRQVFPRPGQPLPDGWRWVKLGEVCKVQGGFAFRSEDYRPNGIPVIRISNLVNEAVEITADTVFVSDNAIVGLDQFRLHKNDLLIAMSGATTGKLGVVPESILPAYLNQRVGRFLPDRKVLDIEYLRYFLGQPKYLQNILSNAFGAAIPNVSPGFIESLDLILAPLSEQKRIAAILREQIAAAERARKAIEEQLEVIQKLPAAILRKAFEGRL